MVHVPPSGCRLCLKRPGDSGLHLLLTPNHTGLGEGACAARGHLSFGEIHVSIENLKIG